MYYNFLENNFCYFLFYINELTKFLLFLKILVLCYNTSMKKLTVLAYASIISIIIGILVWGYLSLTKIGINFMWHTVTENLVLLLLIPIIGGILIGYFELKKGAYPITPKQSLGKYIIQKDFDNPIHIFIGSFLPIISGGSVGPEASLISFSCLFGSKAGDIVRTFEQKVGLTYEMKEYPNGPTTKIIEKIKINKWHGYKILWMNIVAWSTVVIMSAIDNLAGVYVHLGNYEVTKVEVAAFIPLVVIGILIAGIYIFFGKIADLIIKPFKGNIMYISIFIGIVISFSYLISDLLLFSGEHEMHVLAEEFAHLSTVEFAAIALVIMGIYKLLITQLCVRNTWRGGHGFPIIFTSCCIGMAISMVFGINVVFAVAVIASVSIGIVYSPVISLAVMVLIFIPFATFTISFTLICLVVSIIAVIVVNPYLKKMKLFGENDGH